MCHTKTSGFPAPLQGSSPLFMLRNSLLSYSLNLLVDKLYQLATSSRKKDKMQRLYFN